MRPSTPSDMRPGTPLPPPPEMWTDKQTENSTFPHPSDAGGNYRKIEIIHVQLRVSPLDEQVNVNSKLYTANLL